MTAIRLTGGFWAGGQGRRRRAKRCLDGPLPAVTVRITSYERAETPAIDNQRLHGRELEGRSIDGIGFVQRQGGVRRPTLCSAATQGTRFARGTNTLP